MTTPQRIQLHRTKGWRKPPGAVNVARPSRWGNPYRADVFGLGLCLSLYEDTVQGFWNPTLTDGVDEARQKEAYRLHCEFRKRFGREHPDEAMRVELRGRDLCCWCPLTADCHAAILLRLANG